MDIFDAAMFSVQEENDCSHLHWTRRNQLFNKEFQIKICLCSSHSVTVNEDLTFPAALHQMFSTNKPTSSFYWKTAMKNVMYLSSS